MIKVNTITFNEREYFCGYKVVKSDMTSLGLRKNPTPMTFKLDKWIYVPEDRVVEGISDAGGIWLARTPGRARAYQKYMQEKHDAETRVFFSLVDRILFSNQDRIKTNGIRLLEELYL
jgi:hypothetical protein